MSDAVRFQHFEVLRKDDGSLFELGRGAMGITYKAFDTNLRCFVALKVINAAYLNSEIARQRFLREARAAAALRHPNVATVFHLGSEDDNYFYAMEFIDGDTVEGFMKREGAIPAPMALEIASQVSRALGAAQKQSLVHRDIKPSNLMFVHEDGGDEFTVKVIDFGLAKSAASGEDTASLTGGGFLGTPHFASPEQLEERELDVRSDIYSLGVTLWYMLAGKTPFGGSLAQVMSQHLHREPPFENLEGQHAVVIKLLRRMMAKDPKDRPQTPAELRREIEACMEVVQALPTVATAKVSAEAFETEMAATIMTDGGPVEPATGVVLAGRYRLLEEAMASDHGRIFRAEQTEDKAIVGVLILNTNLLATSEAFTRLEQEIEAIQKLRHPAFQRILSLEHANGETFVVVEWTDGPSLLDLLRVRRALTVGEAVRILAQLADAFDELRGSGLSCPDIGAHEVMLPGSDPTEPVTAWKVCTPKFTALTATGGNSSSPDATMVASSFAMMKATGAFAGNPPAAYVFAVAALAYEMLGGVRASGSTSNYVPIPGLSEEGNAALRKALNPAQGYPSARVLVDELAEEDTGAKPVIVATPPSIPATVVPPPVPVTVSTPTEMARAKGKSPLTMILISVAGVLFAFLGVLVIFLGAQKKKPAEVTPPVAQATATPAATPESTPEATPEPVDPQQKAYQDGLAAADELTKQDKVGEALLAYAALATQFPNEKQPHIVMEQLTARARAQKLSETDFIVLRPALEKVADLNVMSAQMLLGERLRKTEPAVALKRLMAAGDQHSNSEAMVHVGEMLAAGAGVDVPDQVEAVQWFTRAKENGSPAGMYALAECKLFRKGTKEDKQGAIDLLSQATALNQPDAMNRLGDLYRRGVPDLLKPNVQEAFRLFTKARELGLLDAQANIGVLYILGEGVPQDAKKAVELFREGAEKGNALCMLNYAKCYANGMGLAKSSTSSKEWFLKAATAGSREAVNWVVNTAREGDSAAMEWCKKNNIPLAN